jgi:site-specific recombinase XerD
MVKLPSVAIEFLEYMETIRGKSKNTITAYGYDLALFFKFIKIKRGYVAVDMEIDDIPVDDIDMYIISNISLADFYSFLSFAANQRDNKNSARARKVACLRSFFKYLHKMKLIDENPALELETPKLNSRQPIHLTLEESKKLLLNVEFKQTFQSILCYLLIAGNLICFIN